MLRVAAFSQCRRAWDVGRVDNGMYPRMTMLRGCPTEGEYAALYNTLWFFQLNVEQWLFFLLLDDSNTDEHLQ